MKRNLYNKEILYLLLENVICTFSAHLKWANKGALSFRDVDHSVNLGESRKKLSYSFFRGLYVSSSQSFQILTLATPSTTGTSTRCRS